MRRLFRRRFDDDVAREVREEIDAHLTLRIEEGVLRGLSPEEARSAAAARLGSVSRAVNESWKIRRKPGRWRRAMVVDVHEVFRGLMRSPAGAGTALLVAAVGLCTTLSAAIVADALLVRPPAGVSRPREIYSVLDSFRQNKPSMLSYLAFRTIAEGAPDLSLCAWGTRDLQLRHRDRGGIMSAALVTGRYFDVLGVRASAGRLLNAHDAGSAAQVAVLSGRAAGRLGVGANDIGATLLVNGQPFALAGIADPVFFGIDAARPIDVWLPVETDPAISKARVFPDGTVVRGYLDPKQEIGWMYGAMRMAPRGDAAPIEARLTALLRPLRANLPERRAILQPRIWLPPFSGNREQLDAVARPLAALAALTLLLTAACMGSLFVARVSGRQRDLAVRLAIGASRGRVMRLCALETAIVLAAGAAIGLFACAALLQGTGHLQLLPGVTLIDTIKRLDARAVGMLALMTLAAGVIAAAGPLAFVARLSASFSQPARSTAPGVKFRMVMMSAQVAAGCALLAGGGFLTQSLWALQARPLGFDASAVSFVEVDPGTAGLSDVERVALADRALAQAAVSRVAIADEVPFGGSSSLITSHEGSRPLTVPATRIAGPYFETLGIGLVAGRMFEQADRHRPVMLVSQPLADSWWPTAGALGRTVTVGRKTYTVVGVVAGVRDLSLRGRPTSRVYLPFDADTEQMTVVARTSNAEAHNKLVQMVQSLDARVAIGRSGTLDRLVMRTIEQRLLLRAFTVVTGVGSLLLVLAGVWGLSHSNLVRRWREIGIRQALGAPRRATVRIVYRDAIIVAATGGAAGALAAWQLGKLLSSMLFQIQPGSPAVLGGASLIVMLAALAGAVLPARRALGLDPASLLRSS